MKKILILTSIIFTILCSQAQNPPRRKLALGIDFSPTQYDKKSEYWRLAENRTITESGASFTANILLPVHKYTFFNLSLTKHKETEEVTTMDNVSQAGDLIIFFISGKLPSSDRIDYRQAIISSSYTLALGGTIEKQTGKRSFIGCEVGAGIRRYTRDVLKITSTNGKETSRSKETTTETVPNVKVRFMVRRMIAANTSIVSKIGIANTPLSIGLQHNF